MTKSLFPSEKKHIGFTGTSMGMTPLQAGSVATILKAFIGVVGLDNVIAHHGVCIGADKDFHDICVSLEIPLELHPGHPNHQPGDLSKRADCKTGKILRVWPAKFYLDRNKDIGNSLTEFLIATPMQYEEQIRGGTWHTIKYVRKLGKPIVIVFPDGKYETPSL